MALIKGTNSFVTLNEADSYFEDRMDASAWADAEDCLKEQALVTATLQLDEMPFGGQVVLNSQLLSFPRSGQFRDPSRGTREAFSSAYVFTADNDETEASLNRDIRLLRRATYELAYHLINNEGLMDKTGSFENIQVGSIKITEVVDASSFPTQIRKILTPLLSGGSTRYWRVGF